MARAGYVDVRWDGGPYDGSSLELPARYRDCALVDLPDPATALNDDPASEPAIYTGPSHRYGLSLDDGGLRARFERTF